VQYRSQQWALSQQTRYSLLLSLPSPEWVTRAGDRHGSQARQKAGPEAILTLRMIVSAFRTGVAPHKFTT
jgi:hypothetical protein